MNQTFTKAMLPLALIVSSIVLNIHNIKNTFSPPPAARENILNIEGGKVDLGNVTGERETVNIKVYVDKDNAVLFHLLPSIVKDLNGTTTLDKPIINITNTPPSQAALEFKKQLTDFVNTVNKSKADNEKITIDTLMSNKGFAISVNSYITYDSTLQGKFELLIDENEYTLDKGAPLLPSVLKTIDEISKETTDAHKRETFM